MNKKKPTDELPDAGASPDEWVSLLRERLSCRKHVFLQLPDGGRIHLDRPLPFLCIYRHPKDVWPLQAERLVTSQAAYMIARDRKDLRILKAATSWLAEEMQHRFGGFLLIELWLEPIAREEERRFRTSYRPAFQVCLSREQHGEIGGTATIFEKSLAKVRVQQQSASVTVTATGAIAPEGLRPIQPRRRPPGFFQLGAGIRPVFVNPETGGIFPLLFGELREQVAVALKETCFDFDRKHTSLGASHYHALGRRSVTSRVREADRELEECSSSFDFLLNVTPVNPEASWRAFRRRGFERAPRFLYRPLPVDPGLIKRRIYSLPIEKIEDPTLSVLFHRKRDEIDRQVTMLFDRETPRFLHGSVQLYGGVDADLLALARELLEKIPRERQNGNGRRELSTASIARKAEEEIAYYRKQYDGFRASVQVREDVPPGVMVSGSRLFIGGGTRIAAHRVNPLLQHEVGTHLLTYFNGAAQPFRQLRSGLAGYEELQEGLATFSEYLAGGLTAGRLRLLAARVVAVGGLLDGAGFTETFRLLHETFDLPPRSAFLAAMRVFRGGGLTKDAIYLRGLRDLLEYVCGDGDLPHLLIGKIAFDHIPVVEELRERKVVREAPVLPRYLKSEEAQQRLQTARHGVPIIQLIQ